MKTIVVGGGGHAAVVIECLRATGAFDVVGIVDADPAAASVLGVPLIGSDCDLASLRSTGIESAVVGLGSNALRLRLGDHLMALGFALPVITHPGAIVSPSATLGVGTVVMAGAIVQARSRIARLCIINTGARVDHDAELAEAVHIAPGACLAGCVEVGARALLGVNSAVRPGMSIGADAVVGAASAVTSRIESGMRVGGVPARPLGTADKA